MVNDPAWKYEGQPMTNQQKATCAKQRKRLFELIEQLVLWEQSSNEALFAKAHDEIVKSWKETCEANRNHRAAELFIRHAPAFHDPFAGRAISGAAPPGSWASDLNPVAVLINKAMIESASSLAVHPWQQRCARGTTSCPPVAVPRGWPRMSACGRWMRERAQQHRALYPK